MLVMNTIPSNWFDWILYFPEFLLDESNWTSLSLGNINATPTVDDLITSESSKLDVRSLNNLLNSTDLSLSVRMLNL